MFARDWLLAVTMAQARLLVSQESENETVAQVATMLRGRGLHPANATREAKSALALAKETK